MTDIVYQYDAICLDSEGNIDRHIYWSPTYPTGCPYGITGHVFQTAFTITSVSENSTVIKDDLSETCGAYRGIGYTFEIGTGPNTGYVDVGEISFPYNVRVQGITINPTEENVGDFFSVLTAKDTIIGVLTQDVSSGTLLNVSPSVLGYVCNGYEITIQNGSNKLVLGECINIDKNAGTITVQDSVNILYPAGSFVMMTMKRIENYRITNTSKVTFGAQTVESSLTPAGVVGTVLYKNMTNTAKKISFLIEIYY